MARRRSTLWIFCFSSRSVKCSSAGPFSRQRFSIISRFFLSINSGRGGITWVCFGLLYVSSFIFGLASTLVALLGIAVLVTYSPQNGIILLVIAFLVSPVGLPMAAAWLVGKVQDLRYVIQDAVYG